MANSREDEIRREFEEWLKDASAKNLDAVMTKIADNALSYEHQAPLQYSGAAAIREVCRQGFEAARGEFRWDIPDLQVIVRDDIAVTWGLNRMQSQEPGKEKLESWSRGTRVFRKINGKWKMIHQHVSFPFDPETGKVRMDLRP
jgi:ketosteroid isomerase-like protein